MPITFGPQVSGPASTIRIDVAKEYGAKGDGTTDNITAIEAAIADLKTRLVSATPGTAGSLYFPMSPTRQPYAVSRPIIIDKDYIGVEGENPSVKISNNSGPTFLFGLRSTETNAQGATLSSDSRYRPDLHQFGMLDTSVMSTTGQRWGYRTNMDSTLLFQGTPGDLGPKENTAISAAALSYAAINSGFKIEMVIRHSGGTPFFGGTTAGIVMLGQSDRTVFRIERGGSTNQFTFTANLADGTEATSSIQGSPTASGNFHICFQLDLINRQILGFLNNVQMAVSSGGTFFAGSGQTSMIRNRHYSLIFGVNTNYSDGYRVPVATTATNGIDYILGGFSLSSQLCYKDNGPGGAQQRIDNGTLNDNYKYLGGGGADANKFFLLTLLNDPAVSTTKRFFTALSNSIGGTYYGLHIENTMFTLTGGITRNFIKNLHVTSTTTSPAVILGGVLDFDFSDMEISSATQSITTLNLLANYVIRMKRCIFGSYDTCYYGSYSVVEMEDVQFQSIIHSAYRLFACNHVINRASVRFGGELTDSFVEVYGGSYGGIHEIKNVLIDFEGGTYRVAPFYLEQHSAYISPSTIFTIENIYVGTTGECDAVLKCVQMNANDGINFMIVNAKNIQTTEAYYKAMVEINGPSIIGRVNYVAPETGNPFVHVGTYGSDCNIQIEHRTIKTLPREGTWLSNGHVIYPQNPTEGEFTEIQCLRSGKFGTANPPVFFGTKQRMSSPSVLSAYITPHAYVSASGSIF